MSWTFAIPNLPDKPAAIEAVWQMPRGEGTDLPPLALAAVLTALSALPDGAEDTVYSVRSAGHIDAIGRGHIEIFVNAVCEPAQ